LLTNEEARMSWSNGLIKNRLKKLNGEDNIAGLLDEAAAIMNNADAVLAGFEAEVVAWPDRWSITSLDRLLLRQRLLWWLDGTRHHHLRHLVQALDENARCCIKSISQSS